MRRPRPCPRADPAPSDQTGVAPCEAEFTFSSFPKSCARTWVAPARTGRGPFPGPPSVGLRLRVDDARGLGLLGPLHHLDLQPLALLLLALQLLPDVGQLPLQLHPHQLQRPP